MAMDPTSRRLVPVICFQCGMPLNNKQATFDALRSEYDTRREQLFEDLHVNRYCCRVTLAFSAEDTRMNRTPVPSASFVPIHRASKLESAPYTVKANGMSDTI